MYLNLDLCFTLVDFDELEKMAEIFYLKQSLATSEDEFTNKQANHLTVFKYFYTVCQITSPAKNCLPEDCTNACSRVINF